LTKLYHRNGRQCVQGIIRESYQEKRQAFEAFLATQTNASLQDFVNDIFTTTVFAGSKVPKVQFILELLHDDMTLDSWIFLRKKFRNLGYLTDRRHCEEYAFDIVLGWLSEELVRKELVNYAVKTLPASQRFEVGFMGIDAEREFQDMNIRAKADLYIITDPRNPRAIQYQYQQETGRPALQDNDETPGFRKWFDQQAITKIDLFVDYKGTWQQNDYFDIKKGKIAHFEKQQLDWVLAMDVTEQHLYLISRDEVLGYDLTPNPAMGNVLTAQVPLTEPLTFTEVFTRLQLTPAK
jgi:hypothetical protein